MTTQITTQYAKTVDSIQEAFGFVMDCMEKLGEEVSIDIHPFWDLQTVVVNALNGNEASSPPLKFEAVVSGMREEE